MTTRWIQAALARPLRLAVVLALALVLALEVGAGVASVRNSSNNNIAATLAATKRQTSSFNASGIAIDGLLSSWTPPLSTRGRFVVDANGNRFRLQGGNWHGASGTYLGQGTYSDPNNHHAGEVAYQTVLGLDRVPIDDIVASFLELGINTVRLPFSNQMVNDKNPVPDAAVKANPQLRGLTPLQIYDATVAALTKRGIAVILNNHTIKSLWCCSADTNSRWNSAQSTAQWENDWITMARRYKDNKRVVGADLYNEVRRDIFNDLRWGGGDQYDWWAASLEAGNRILREANPDLLIVVEGINFVGVPLDGQPHGRPILLPVKALSHTLAVQDKLVYSAHFYAFIGPNNTGADSGPFVTKDPLFRDLSADQLRQSTSDLAAYVAAATNASATQHYTAPVWISEFGVGGRPDTLTKDRDWWSRFVQLLVDFDLDYAVWPLVGWQKYGLGDGYALNAWDENGQRLSILDAGDWRLPSWVQLSRGSASVTSNQPAVRRGQVDPLPVWRMLAPDWGGAQLSTTLAGDISWHPGDTRASCPDGLRLHALSRSTIPRGLCTDAVLGRSLWNYQAPNARAGVQYVSDERYVPASQDWAKGRTKFQCAPDSFMIGYTYTASNGKSAAAVCAPLNATRLGELTTGGPQAQAQAQAQATGNRTVDFSARDNLSNSPSRGAWASPGSNVGACAEDELLIGLAVESASGLPAVLLCRTFNSSTTVDVTSSAPGPVAFRSSLWRSAWMIAACMLLWGPC